MEHPEKLSRLNPALVDKMIRTEDAVTRGRAELARRAVRRSSDHAMGPDADSQPDRRSTIGPIRPEAAVVGFVLVLAAVLIVTLLLSRPPA